MTRTPTPTPTKTRVPRRTRATGPTGQFVNKVSDNIAVLLHPPSPIVTKNRPCCIASPAPGDNMQLIASRPPTNAKTAIDDKCAESHPSSRPRWNRKREVWKALIQDIVAQADLRGHVEFLPAKNEKHAVRIPSCCVGGDAGTPCNASLVWLYTRATARGYRQRSATCDVESSRLWRRKLL